MKISLIVASASNRAIGKNNQLLWHLPKDLAFFKAHTMGKPMIMGRKTFESIGKPLPGRPHIVVTRDETYQPAGVSTAHSLEEAIAMAKKIAHCEVVDEIMVIGGAQIYEQALPFADRLYLTQVDAVFEKADAFFPEVDFSLWQEISREDFTACEKNPYAYHFLILDKK